MSSLAFTIQQEEEFTDDINWLSNFAKPTPVKMGKKKGGFYAVHTGKKPGVYLTWDQCQSQVSGFPNAKFKKFPTHEQAEAYASADTNASATRNTLQSDNGIDPAQVTRSVGHSRSLPNYSIPGPTAGHQTTYQTAFGDATIHTGATTNTASNSQVIDRIGNPELLDTSAGYVQPSGIKRASPGSDFITSAVDDQLSSQKVTKTIASERIPQKNPLEPVVLAHRRLEDVGSGVPTHVSDDVSGSDYSVWPLVMNSASPVKKKPAVECVSKGAEQVTTTTERGSAVLECSTQSGSGQGVGESSGYVVELRNGNLVRVKAAPRVSEGPVLPENDSILSETGAYSQARLSEDTPASVLTSEIDALYKTFFDPSATTSSRSPTDDEGASAAEKYMDSHFELTDKELEQLNGALDQRPIHLPMVSLTPTPEDQRLLQIESGRAVVYVDGSALGNNQTIHSRAGFGVFWNYNHRWNTGHPLQNGFNTNQRAELRAAVHAIHTALVFGIEKLEIRSDSKYTINAMSKWKKKWVMNNWKDAKGRQLALSNIDLLKALHSAEEAYNLRYNTKVAWRHVSAHVGIPGNEAADKLAKLGASGQFVGEKLFSVTGRKHSSRADVN